MSFKNVLNVIHSRKWRAMPEMRLLFSEAFSITHVPPINTFLTLVKQFFICSSNKMTILKRHVKMDLLNRHKQTAELRKIRENVNTLRLATSGS